MDRSAGVAATARQRHCTTYEASERTNPLVLAYEPAGMPVEEVAGVVGFEPTTVGLEGRCSIQLSYTPSVTGVAEGSRTPHLRSHNPVLYLMSYGHHWNNLKPFVPTHPLWRVSWSG